MSEITIIADLETCVADVVSKTINVDPGTLDIYTKDEVDDAIEQAISNKVRINLDCDEVPLNPLGREVSIGYDTDDDGVTENYISFNRDSISIKVSEDEDGLGDKEVNVYSPVFKYNDKEVATVDQIPSLTGYAKTTDIPDVSNLATKDEIPSLTGYAKTTDIPSLEGYAKLTDIPQTTGGITESQLNTKLSDYVPRNSGDERYHSHYNPHDVSYWDTVYDSHLKIGCYGVTAGPHSVAWGGTTAYVAFGYSTSDGGVIRMNHPDGSIVIDHNGIKVGTKDDPTQLTMDDLKNIKNIGDIQTILQSI